MRVAEAQYSPVYQPDGYSAQSPQAADFVHEPQRVPRSASGAVSVASSSTSRGVLTQTSSHSPVRTNQAIMGSSSRGVDASPARKGAKGTHLESAITHLLMNTKTLLETLNNVALGKATREEMSEIYVALGNQFYITVDALANAGLDTEELPDVADKLREPLKLIYDAQDPPAAVHQHLPAVRGHIVALITGLKERQAQFKVNQGRQRTVHSPVTSSAGLAMPPIQSSVYPPKPAVSAAEQYKNSYVQGHAQQPVVVGSAGSIKQTQVIKSIERQSPVDSNFSGHVMEKPAEQATKNHYGELSQSAGPSNPPTRSRDSSMSQTTVVTSRFSNDSDEAPQRTSTAAAPKIATRPANPIMSPPPPDAFLDDDWSLARRTPSITSQTSIPKPTSQPAAAVASIQPSARDIPPTSTPPIPTLTQEETRKAESSLRALQKSDMLERRSSRRFSQHVMVKMGAMGPIDSDSGDLLRASDLDKVDKIPPLPSPLAAVLEDMEADDVDEKARTTKTSPASASVKSEAPLQTTPQTKEEPLLPFVLFLTIGLQTRRVPVDDPKLLSISSIQILFVDKFEYSPDGADFPEIYCRDASTGIEYLLENCGELQSGSRLILHIQERDQIQHLLEQRFASFTQEIQEMKQLIKTTSTPRAAAINLDPVHTPIPSPMPVTASKDVIVLPGGTIPADIKPTLLHSMNEVVSIRQSLGVLRQLYNDFTKTTKASIVDLRQQAASVRTATISNIQQSRAQIEIGKANMEKTSTELLTKLNAATDPLEDAMNDLTERRIQPRPARLKQLKNDFDEIQAQLDTFMQQLAINKLAWKKTWESELKVVIEEQKLVKWHGGFAQDMQTDLKQAKERHGQLEEASKLGASIKGKSGRSFTPVNTQDEDPTTGVLTAIRAQSSDPDRRMKAIAQAESRRVERDPDDFSEELKGFVGQNGLRKTGGTEEAERLRQVKNERSLKAAFGLGQESQPRSASALSHLSVQTETPDDGESSVYSGSEVGQVPEPASATS